MWGRRRALSLAKSSRPVGGVDEDHPDRHFAEDGLQPVLGLAPMLGHLPEATLALARLPLELDARGDLVKRVDRDDLARRQRYRPRVQHRPALGAIGEPKADQGRLDFFAGQDAATGEKRAVERVAGLVDELEAIDENAGEASIISAAESKPDISAATSFA